MQARGKGEVGEEVAKGRKGSGEKRERNGSGKHESYVRRVMKEEGKIWREMRGKKREM